MKRKERRILLAGGILLASFAVWTTLVQMADVQSIGQNGTDVGFATLNSWFHKLTGVHMVIYTMTDWLGLIPLFICMIFAAMGIVQLVKGRGLMKVDYDILFLGIYYIIVIFAYLIFEMIPINYRPILIEGRMEASYPSSTTLLVLSVMPTLVFQVNRRVEDVVVKGMICISAYIFSVFMVIGRLVSGVHWFTDIVGSVLFSIGIFCVYKAIVLLHYKED